MATGAVAITSQLEQQSSYSSVLTSGLAGEGEVARRKKRQIRNFEISKIVVKPTWKEILIDLIHRERLDPWNIDIIALANGFMKRINEMKKLDFVVEANVILAAAILLRYKSDYLKMFSNIYSEQAVVGFGEEEGEGEPDEPGMRYIEPLEIPEISILSRIPPKRQITLDELLDEMDKIINIERRERKPRGRITETVEIKIEKTDIEKIMAETVNMLRENVDSQGWALFSSLISGKPPIKIVELLIAILHLTKNGVIDIRQDEMFGEIFICFLNGKGEVEGNAQ